MATITAASCLAQLSTISHELATVREQLKQATSTLVWGETAETVGRGDGGSHAPCVMP
jgi:hypothetical protein